MLTYVFISHSREDGPDVARLLQHLSTLQSVSITSSGNIPAGATISGVVLERIQTAHVIVQITSASYLTSELDLERRYIERRRQDRTARIGHVQLRPVVLPPDLLGREPFNDRPLTTCDNADLEWAKVARRLQLIIEGPTSSVPLYMPPTASLPPVTNWGGPPSSGREPRSVQYVQVAPPRHAEGSQGSAGHWHAPGGRSALSPRRLALVAGAILTAAIAGLAVWRFQFADTEEPADTIPLPTSSTGAAPPATLNPSGATTISPAREAPPTYNLAAVSFNANLVCDTWSACDILWNAQVNGRTVCQGGKRQDDNHPRWTGLRCSGIAPGDWVSITFYDADLSGSRYVGSCRFQAKEGSNSCNGPGWSSSQSLEKDP